ncbi:MAG: HAD family hydrolase [Bacteroidia bacterium]|nr:HAD family hydrolase [Bacteroidia bacterium]
MDSKAIFLDRDGVVNRERSFTWKLEDFEILPGFVPALKIWQAKGYRFIIVSNQSGIAKGLYRQEDTELLHSHLVKEMAAEGIEFDEIYYCVHHPDVSACICRKPDSLFIEKALSRFRLKASACYFIGDKDRDVEAARKAGVTGILIEANRSLLEIIQLID